MARTPSYTTLKERADEAATAVTSAPTDDVMVTADEQALLNASVANIAAAQAAELALAKAQAHRERNEIYTETVIDPHEGRLATITGYWEPLTPSRCTEPRCSWDAAKEMGFAEGWDSIPVALRFGHQTMREFALEKLAQHRAVRHAVAQTHIRTAAEAREARAQVPLPTTFIENPRL